jgi:hypothetical protein
MYKYRVSPTIRSIDFIIECTIPKSFILQVNIDYWSLTEERHDGEFGSHLAP